jgi:hypothetical protein
VSVNALVLQRIADLEFGIARYYGKFGRKRVEHTTLRGDASGPRAEKYRRLIGQMRTREARVKATGSSSSQLEDSWIVGKGEPMRLHGIAPSVQKNPKGFQLIKRPSSSDANYTRISRILSASGREARAGEGAYRSASAGYRDFLPGPGPSGTTKEMYKYARQIEVRGGHGSTSAVITKYGPRNAKFDLLDSDDGLHGRPKGGGQIRSVMKHFKKNKVTVDFHPHAMSSSTNKGAVTQTDKLLKSYTRIATKMGFRREGDRLSPRFVP